LRSSRNSADSVAVTPGRLPSSISASLSHRCRHDSEIPKSFAICANGASPLRATATTSRRNSAGNAFGMTDILPARNRSSQVRSQPNRGQTQAGNGDGGGGGGGGGCSFRGFEVRCYEPGYGAWVGSPELRIAPGSPVQSEPAAPPLQGCYAQPSAAPWSGNPPP